MLKLNGNIWPLKTKCIMSTNMVTCHLEGCLLTPLSFSSQLQCYDVRLEVKSGDLSEQLSAVIVNDCCAQM